MILTVKTGSKITGGTVGSGSMPGLGGQIAMMTGGNACETLPGFAVFASNSLSEVREHIARTYCPHHLSVARRGERLDAWLNHKRLNDIGIGAMTYGAEVSIEGIEDEDMLLLMQPLAGAAEVGTRRGTVLSTPAIASVVNTRDLKRMHWSADCTQRVVQISNRALDHHATMMIGRPLSRELEFAQEMPVNAGNAHWWHYASLLSMELSAASGSESRAVLGSLETLLILKLLESHPNNYSEHLRPQPCKIAPHHVRRVEQFIIAHAAEPVTLDQLVDVSGVSARALFDGFRRFRGTSPMAFLKAVRLERARDDLRQAEPGTSVTSVACKWGFYQFGRFSAQYRKMFGELPSETLRNLN